MNEVKQVVSSKDTVSADSWHEVRAEIANQQVKSLLLINGGAAVALLAFLQAIWNDNPELSLFVVIAIWILCFGVAAAGLSNWLRYKTSAHSQAKTEERRSWSRKSNIVQMSSLVCFIVAVLIFAIGALGLLILRINQ